jgi:hypothetical protein
MENPLLKQISKASNIFSKAQSQNAVVYVRVSTNVRQEIKESPACQKKNREKYRRKRSSLNKH